MRSISAQSALQALQSHASDHHVDARLLEVVERASKLYLIKLRDKDAFYSLIWQEIDSTRILTPRSDARRSRRLIDVARYMADREFTFAKLSQGTARGEGSYDPSWFVPCVEIEKRFEYGRFGWIGAMLPTDEERKQSPKGSFYVYDGVHKSLVLSHLLHERSVEYEPVQLLLLLPRTR